MMESLIQTSGKDLSEQDWDAGRRAQASCRLRRRALWLKPGLKALLCYPLALWSSVDISTFLNVSFLIYKIRIEFLPLKSDYKK